MGLVLSLWSIPKEVPSSDFVSTRIIPSYRQFLRAAAHIPQSNKGAPGREGFFEIHPLAAEALSIKVLLPFHGQRNGVDGMLGRRLKGCKETGVFINGGEYCVSFWENLRFRANHGTVYCRGKVECGCVPLSKRIVHG